MPLAVCATPIGNLEDVTLRVLRELAEADVVLCEDTRQTRKLLERHGVRARLLSYHQHNEAARTAALLPRLQAGERIALVSDAGLPGISDPGARLIRAAREAGAEVTVLPGPSAVETALVASGFEAERYQFVGYLPRGEKALGALAEELRAWPWPVVAFESPQRLAASLACPRGGEPGSPGGGLPRADEAVRRGRGRDACRAGEPVPGRSQGRDHAGARPGRRAGRRRGGRLPRRWPSSLAWAYRAGRRPRSSPA